MRRASGPINLTPRSKKQKESALQRLIVSSLNAGGYGYFFRIRNGATYDPRIGRFRVNTAEKGIVDLLGWTTHPLPVTIEVKYFETIEKKKKISHVVLVSEEQKEFLYRSYKAGNRSGIAFTVDDAIAIVTNNHELWPRHPRTWRFLPEEEYVEKVALYLKYKKEKTITSRDPLRKILDGNKSVMR